MCHKHNAIVESFTSCGLCRRRLTIGSICTLGVRITPSPEIRKQMKWCLKLTLIGCLSQVSREELPPLVEALNRDSIPSHLASESTFVCKLCKAFCGVKVSSTKHSLKLVSHTVFR